MDKNFRQEPTFGQSFPAKTYNGRKSSREGLKSDIVFQEALFHKCKEKFTDIRIYVILFIHICLQFFVEEQLVRQRKSKSVLKISSSNLRILPKSGVFV